MLVGTTNSDELSTSLLVNSNPKVAINKAIKERDKNKNASGDDMVRFSNWPLSRSDKIRQDPNKQAILSDDMMADVQCPQCNSILVGNVSDKKILLLGHALNFAGG